MWVETSFNQSILFGKFLALNGPLISMALMMLLQHIQPRLPIFKKIKVFFFLIKKRSLQRSLVSALLM
jgi:hypothetical protein